MNFRSITDLTELESLPDDAKILVIDGGTAKQISKENAKFGGGTINYLYLKNEAATTPTAVTTTPTVYLDKGCTVKATAQNVYDLFQAGEVRAQIDNSGLWVGDSAILVMWMNADGTQTDPTAVTYACIYTACMQNQIDIGTQPS